VSGNCLVWKPSNSPSDVVDMHAGYLYIQANSAMKQVCFSSDQIFINIVTRMGVSIDGI
jgi:hypothetical protein